MVQVTSKPKGSTRHFLQKVPGRTLNETMETHHQQINFNEQRAKSKKRGVFFLIGLAVFISFLFSLGQASNVITAENRPWWQKVGNLFGSNILPISPTREEKELLNKNFPLPAEEEHRWDLLILGIRGTDDPDGGLLSDSIMFFSLDKKTGQSSLVSIPRDLYVNLPGMSKGKINEIYEKGLTRKKSLEFSREAFSRLTGVYIDNTIVFDFKAFKEIVDDLGGIDIALKKPFEEKNQWGYEFSLPAGPNHLNGQDALYFVRSRYSTSDFDRSIRQQQVIFAIKDKALSIGVLANPLKLAPILKSANQNIVSDLNIFDTGNLIQLANSLNAEKVKPAREHLSTENILYEIFQENIYVLLPKNDNWKLFRDFFQQRFNLKSIK